MWPHRPPCAAQGPSLWCPPLTPCSEVLSKPAFIHVSSVLLPTVKCTCSFSLSHWCSLSRCFLVEPLGEKKWSYGKAITVTKGQAVSLPEVVSLGALEALSCMLNWVSVGTCPLFPVGGLNPISASCGTSGPLPILGCP